MHERSYWLGFATFPGIGPGKFGLLLAAFGSAEAAWKADLHSLQQTKIGQKLCEAFVDYRKTFSLEMYQERLSKSQVCYLTLQDTTYPTLLRQIKNPPFVLFVKGIFDFHAPDNQQTIGIVGTRRITEYGKQVTELFTQDLVHAGFTVVSGLALGVDAVSHQTTINSEGRTVAVLGCGVDCCYPRENQQLYNHIVASGGVIVSEYALGMQPSRGSFPSRNRIIAGLSRGVLVTEGAAQSGSLITANDAFTNSRPVFAVPGSINSSLSSGPAKLIQQGATLVTNANDIMHVLGGTRKRTSKQSIKGDTQEEQVLIDLLQQGEIHFDELVLMSELSSSELAGSLSVLEMKGIIKRLDAGMFSLNS